MSDDKKKGKLTLGLGGGKPNISGGPKTVTVEVRRKRVINKPGGASSAASAIDDSNLSDKDKQKRLEILEKAKQLEEKQKQQQEELERQRKEREEREKEANEKAAKEAAERGEKAPAPATARPAPTAAPVKDFGKDKKPAGKLTLSLDKDKAKNAGKPKNSNKRKITITNFDQEDRQRSMASIKRQREKAKKDAIDGGYDEGPKEKVIREVTIPETITVGELANRMSEKAADVVRELMKLGVMATINQPIDADTAELVVSEFGHKFTRVTEGDVENILDEIKDDEKDLKPRPPVVTIMGHVDHGKTSLLDALRQANVVSGEAGGITQHIGAYQVELEGKGKISFIDTPGHEAFTEMRARGAQVTDIVVLVVAADDGIKEQTKEAIAHSKAAEVPIIVAINKIDKPEADINRVKNELLQNELIPEDMGGEVICVPVSAKTGDGLDDLKENILLQSEILELKANPDRSAVGTVIEARVDKGRGVVATVVVQHGTMKVGEIVVAGSTYGRVRALLDDNLQNVEEADPAMPVEILGLAEAPLAGDSFNVVESEKQAREIVEYRTAKTKAAKAAADAKSAMDKLMDGKQGESKELAVIIKGDVQGSIEAIAGSLEKLKNEEVNVRVIHSAVGAITESDITLANASEAFVIAFNVRANAKAREMANRDQVEIRYYSIIYEVMDDVKAALEGLLSPISREEFIGYSEIRDVFNITKVGKVAGCYVTEGHVKRGAGVRLLRDNVVIHEGKLKTLKRFKEEVKEVQNGYECGMAFENYDDIKPGDVIECYEVIEEAAKLKA